MMALLLNANDSVSRSYSITKPSPLHPIMPSECGERTGNLAPFIDEWGYGYVTTGGMLVAPTGNQERYSPRITVEPGATYRIAYQTGSFPADDESDWDKKSWIGIGLYSDDGFIKRITLDNASMKNFETPANARYVILSFRSFGENYNCMFIKAPTPPDTYIPYGYKLPLTANGVEYPIYLGESQTTRRIKKLVLTGEETWTKRAYGNTNYTFEHGLNTRSLSGLCSHYARYTSAQIDKFNGIYLSKTTTIIITDLRFTTATDFKSYLAAQYAAGTPVTVWYVLAEPETGIVNEPLMKIGDYADTIDSTQTTVRIPTAAGTTVIDYDGEGLAPSEVDSIQEWVDIPTYTYTNGAWVADN